MSTKTSEKKLAVSLTCLAIGIILFLSTPVVTTPVLVSEKGILSAAVALTLVAFALFSFKDSVRKV
jgi:tetrahydromethanopterin S-methyltransferase subunit E